MLRTKIKSTILRKFHAKHSENILIDLTNLLDFLGGGGMILL